MNVFLKFCRLSAVIAVALHALSVSAQDMPWHLGSLDATASAPSALNTAAIKPGPHDVTVAVIDSGVLPNHPSLKGRVLPGFDMISG
jgi:subtilisin family serine protease